MARQGIVEISHSLIMQPTRWPLYPILPVKSRKLPFLDPKFCAIIHVAKPTRVYFVDLFTLKTLKGRELNTIEFHDYPDLNALLDDYQVD